MTERKKEIHALAQALFREKGYPATSVRDIAAAAHVEPASLYSHIKGKEELLDAICFEMAGKFLTVMKEVNDIYFDAVQKLAMAVKNHIRLLTDFPDAAVVFMRDWRYLSDERKAEFIALRDQYEDGFRAIVRKGVDEGAFNEVDVRFAALTILSSLNWVVEWYHEDGKLKPEEIADQLTKFILTGLQKELPVTYGLVTG